LRCNFCGGNYQNDHCSAPSDGQQEEKAYYLQNQARPQQKFQGSYQGYRGGSGSNQPYGWRPHNNACSSPNNTSFLGHSNNYYGGSSNKGPQQQQAQLDRLSKMEDTLNQLMQVSILNQKNIDTSIKNLEVQVGQLVKQMSEHESGSFSATTEVNPREQCNAITARRGIVVGLKDESEFSENKTNEGVVKISDEKEVVEKEQKNELLAKEKQVEKQKLPASKKGKVILDHSPIQHLPYPNAPSKKDKEK